MRRRAPWAGIPRLEASHRALGYGSDEDLERMEDDADELDGNVLDGSTWRGERFDRMVKRVLVS